jgi:hypothetical protein
MTSVFAFSPASVRVMNSPESFSGAKSSLTSWSFSLSGWLMPLASSKRIGRMTLGFLTDLKETKILLFGK